MVIGELSALGPVVSLGMLGDGRWTLYARAVVVVVVGGGQASHRSLVVGDGGPAAPRG